MRPHAEKCQRKELISIEYEINLSDLTSSTKEGRHISRARWTPAEKFAGVLSYGLYGKGDNQYRKMQAMLPTRSPEQIRTFVVKGRLATQAVLEDALQYLFPAIPEGFQFSVLQAQMLAGRGARFGGAIYDDALASNRGSRVLHGGVLMTISNSNSSRRQRRQPSSNSGASSPSASDDSAIAAAMANAPTNLTSSTYGNNRGDMDENGEASVDNTYRGVFD